jgi:hypothetical protein
MELIVSLDSPPKIPSSPFFWQPTSIFIAWQGEHPPFLDDFPKASIEFGHFPAMFEITGG